VVRVFSLEGTLDLLNAVTQRLRYTEGGTLGATFFIPMVVVPALLVSHVMIFIVLLRGERTSPGNRDAGGEAVA
jgi:hypothetical protein